jgi:gluconolactonase
MPRTSTLRSTISRRQALAAVCVPMLGACASPGAAPRPTPAPILRSLPGAVTRRDARLDAVVDSAATVHVLSEGYRWSEGPVWVPQRNWLLFCDVPGNVMYRWRSGVGTDVFMEPSGLPSPTPTGTNGGGGNGMALDAKGNVLVADHGGRAIYHLNLDTKTKTPVATHYAGKRFSSPNDLVRTHSGVLYFTDPPYGLEGNDNSKFKEQPHNGVYRQLPDGAVDVIDASLSRPNGVALSPDQRTLYVAVSDPATPHVYAYVLDAAGRSTGRKLFHDFTPFVSAQRQGLPDGLKVDTQGRVYCTGPGGVHILSPEGDNLGHISTGKAVSNLAFGEDGHSLFLTSMNMLAVIALRARGV